MKKNVLFFVLCFFAGSVSLAQNQSFTPRFADPDADKFIGTWKYESAAYSISITLTKGVIAGFDHVFGAYRVQRDGRVFEDLSGRGITGMTLPYPDGNPNQLNLRLFDTETSVCLSEFTLIMLEGYTDRAILNIIEPPRRQARTLPARQRQPLPEDMLQLEGSLTVAPAVPRPSIEERQRNRPTARQILQDGIVLVRQ